MRVHHPLIQSTVLCPPSFGSRMTGFIQGVLLFGIALLAVVIAAFSMSNRSSSNSTTNEEAKTHASSILAAANQIKTAVDRFVADRGEITNMTFNSTAPNGLFNITDNFMASPQLPARAFSSMTGLPATVTDTRNGYFNFKRGSALINGFATSAINSGPLTLLVCQRINQTIFRDQTVPTVTGSGAETIWQGANGNMVVPANTFGTGVPFEEGCIRLAGDNGNLYYFKVVNR